MDRQRKQLKILALFLSVILTCGCGGSGESGNLNIATEEFTSDDLDNLSGLTLNESIDGNEWLNRTLFSGSNRADPRLPGYSYFQGLVQSGQHVRVIGQVRVVGGIITTEEASASIASGAMITTNPYSFTKSDGLTGGPEGIKTRVGHWEEIPTL